MGTSTSAAATGTASGSSGGEKARRIQAMQLGEIVMGTLLLIRLFGVRGPVISINGASDNRALRVAQPTTQIDATGPPFRGPIIHSAL